MKLLRLYQNQVAVYEGNFRKVTSNRDDKIYAFVRERGRDRVLVVVNLSDQAQTVTLKDSSLCGTYRDCFNDREVTLDTAPSLKLLPWDYRVYAGGVGQGSD